MIDLSLSKPQAVFLFELPTVYRAFVGGFGSGKTFTACLDQLLYCGQNTKARMGQFGLSYPAIRDIYYPTIDKASYMLGFKAKIKIGYKEVDFYRNGAYYGTTICRTMDDPENIVGFEIERALVDEIDLLATEKADLAWNKIIARNRLKRTSVIGIPNSTGVTTTPEGFKFVYRKFKERPTKRFSMVQCSTFENIEHLPEDYIPSLHENYPSNVIEAYLNGQFVNLSSGTVYYGFDRTKHRSIEKVEPKDHLYIGMDFNVQKQCAVVFVRRGDEYHAVREFTGMFDTPAAINTIKNHYPDHHITIYPDASGGARKSVDASTSDLALLSQAGFVVRNNRRNPAIKDRVLAVNAALEKARLFVNDKTCPIYAKALEQQAYDKNGMPEKDDTHEHINDAAGYFIVFEMPVVKPQTIQNIQVLR